MEFSKTKSGAIQMQGSIVNKRLDNKKKKTIIEET